MSCAVKVAFSQRGRIFLLAILENVREPIKTAFHGDVMAGHLEAGILTVTSLAASLLPITGVVMVTMLYRLTTLTEIGLIIS